MKIITLIFFLVFSLSSKAQNPKFQLGLVSGPSVTTFFGNDAIEDFYDPAIKYAAGVTLDFRIKKRLSLGSGLVLEQNYGSGNFTFTDQIGNPTGTYKSEIIFNQLNLPVVVNAKLIDRKFDFITTLGPQLQYLISQKESAYNSSSQSTVLINNLKNYSRINIGLIVGLGTSYQLNEQLNLNFELRNNLGLSNVSKLGTIKINSTSLLLGLSYQL